MDIRRCAADDCPNGDGAMAGKREGARFCSNQCYERARYRKDAKLRYQRQKLESVKGVKTTCPNGCGLTLGVANINRHISLCDGRGLVCEWNPAHSFKNPGSRRSHEKCCPDAPGRECSNCETWKPWDEYNKHSGRMSGFSSYCRTCDNEQTKAWKKSNPDKYLAGKKTPVARDYTKKWRAANKEHLRDYKRDKYREDPEHHLLLRKKARRRSGGVAVHKCKNPDCGNLWSNIGISGGRDYCQVTCYPPKKRWRPNSELRRAIARRDGWNCQGCGDKLSVNQSTIDHCFSRQLIAQLRAEGHPVDDEWNAVYGLWNLELFCGPCNNSKKTKIYRVQARRALDRFRSDYGKRPPPVLWIELALREPWGGFAK